MAKHAEQTRGSHRAEDRPMNHPDITNSGETPRQAAERFNQTDQDPYRGRHRAS